MRDDIAADGRTVPVASGEDAVGIDAIVAGLHQAHALTLVRMASLLLRDRQCAEDVVQDAFVGLYRAMPRLTDHAWVLPYLRAAEINRARTVQRARERAGRQPALHQPPGSSAESAALERADRAAVMAAVARLPRRARVRYYLDLSDAEIAATLGVTRGTVSSTASRTLMALARSLEEEL